MKVLDPTPITTAGLISSTLAEDDHPVWAPGTTYADKALVIVPATHRIYESVGSGNIGFDPVSHPDKWIDLGPTNRWAMLDKAVGTLSVGVGVIDVTLAPGGVGALAAIDTDAETIRVIVSVDGVTLYDQTRSTNVSGGIIADWHTYFTAEVGKVGALVFTNLPAYANGRVRVILTGRDPGGPVSIGTLLAGKMINLGTTEAGASVGINDFSRKETDEFGVTTIVERPWSKRMTARAMLETSAVGGIQRRLAALRAKPALWIGEEGYDELTIYGFFKDFSIDLALESVSYCSLTIEGLI